MSTGFQLQAPMHTVLGSGTFCHYQSFIQPQIQHCNCKGPFGTRPHVSQHVASSCSSTQMLQHPIAQIVSCHTLSGGKKVSVLHPCVTVVCIHYRVGPPCTYTVYPFKIIKLQQQFRAFQVCSLMKKCASITIADSVEDCRFYNHQVYFLISVFRGLGQKLFNKILIYAVKRIEVLCEQAD